MNERFAVDLAQLDQTQRPLVGGKAAQLGELARMEGVHVPDGFCVTTDAFRHVMLGLPWIDDRIERLSKVDAGDLAAIRARSADVRRAFEVAAVPRGVRAAILGAVLRHGQRGAYAVRSSATAEDASNASFAGQHDTYLNVTGPAEILKHVVRCWASLFSERSVSYRLRSGVDHRASQMAVIVQQMVFPLASGALFTADPVTSHRSTSSIEATFGLGETLVSGLVAPDVYAVRDGCVVKKDVATKQRSSQASPEGGTIDVPIAPQRQRDPVLSEAQILRLTMLGRKIEAHFGRPQDIEWCLADDEFQIVQSRPITTLFPIPASPHKDTRIYISVGHQQMMTDAMKPLGLSMWQLTAARPMHEAGGRLFVDVTNELASPARRAGFLAAWERGDPLTGAALRAIAGRTRFLPGRTDDAPVPPPDGADAVPNEPESTIVARLTQQGATSLDRLRDDIRTKSGEALLEFILADLNELKRVLFGPPGPQVIRSAMHAHAWLNEHLETWLGEIGASDTLSQSVPNNVTSEMGLALLDVADAIRPYPEVVELLRQAEDDRFLEVLPSASGGREAKDAISSFLDSYGMRCNGEIDITRPRWSERPTALLPMILSNVTQFEPGAAKRSFERRRRAALAKERDVLMRLRALPDGEEKAQQTKAMIDRLRSSIGYREYPKYHMVSRYFVYKGALLHEAERLVERQVLTAQEDIFYLSFEELHGVVRTNEADASLIRERRDAFRSHQALTPPRVLTSEGEVIAGSYGRSDVPPGALVGLPVSAGTAEGRARVVLDVADADLGAGDILVTAYTDPSWTPLFVAIAGLVTEVGGLMTHGAVIAREYGLAAVVGVEHATRRIQDGQRIRVHGLEGYVEILT